MNEIKKLGRNEQCHCGSGKKYKRCCIGQDEFARASMMFLAAAGRSNKIILSSFEEYFPDIASNETRHFWPKDRDYRTDPAIRIRELYCRDPKCDCKRVLLTLIDHADPKDGILTVSYAFDRNDPEPGPYIDPLNSLTPQGRDLFPWVCELLATDHLYVDRLRRHYELMKLSKLKSRNLIEGSRPKARLLLESGKTGTTA